MQLKRGRKNYTADFRLESAGLVVDDGYSVSKAAEAMEVGKSTMTGWVKQLKEERIGISPSASPNDARAAENTRVGAKA